MDNRQRAPQRALQVPSTEQQQAGADSDADPSASASQGASSDGPNGEKAEQRALRQLTEPAEVHRHESATAAGPSVTTDARVDASHMEAKAAAAHVSTAAGDHTEALAPVAVDAAASAVNAASAGDVAHGGDASELEGGDTAVAMDTDASTSVGDGNANDRGCTSERPGGAAAPSVADSVE